MVDNENNAPQNLEYRCIHLSRAQMKQSGGRPLTDEEAYCVSGECGGVCDGRVNGEELVQMRKYPHIYHL